MKSFFTGSKQNSFRFYVDGKNKDSTMSIREDINLFEIKSRKRKF